MNSKIVHLTEFKPYLEKKTVLVGGCFDILHIGHVRFLQEAKKQGDILIIALESDEFIKNAKKRLPFHDIDERAEVLAALTAVDIIILLPPLQSDEDYANVVKQIQPDVIAITQGDPQEINKRNHAQAVNAKLEMVISHLPGKSTTEIFKKGRSLVDNIP